MLLTSVPGAQTALERIARTRVNGVLRSELPKQLGVKQSNFFYVMKQLLARNLVKATPIKFSRNRSCISTAAVHLTQFAPEISLASCQVRLDAPLPPEPADSRPDVTEWHTRGEKSGRPPVS